MSENTNQSCCVRAVANGSAAAAAAVASAGASNGTCCRTPPGSENGQIQASASVCLRNAPDSNPEQGADAGCSAPATGQNCCITSSISDEGVQSSVSHC